MKTAILISGSGSNMVALVNAMTRGDVPADPVLVIANQQGAGGIDKARALGVDADVIAHKDFPNKAAFEAALSIRLKQAGTELICLAGFMRILSPEFVAEWAGKILNIHPSLLPAFKGLDTHERALAAGCAVHGVSVHEVTAELDDGRIIGQAVVPVKAGDTPADLAARVLVQEHQLYPRAVRKFIQNDPTPLLLGIA